MDELQKTLYAHWILDECNSPVEEIEWLVNCILSKNRDRFKKQRCYTYTNCNNNTKRS